MIVVTVTYIWIYYRTSYLLFVLSQIYFFIFVAHIAVTIFREIFFFPFRKSFFLLIPHRPFSFKLIRHHFVPMKIPPFGGKCLIVLVNLWLKSVDQRDKQLIKWWKRHRITIASKKFRCNTTHIFLISLSIANSLQFVTHS